MLLAAIRVLFLAGVTYRRLSDRAVHENLGQEARLKNMWAAAGRRLCTNVEHGFICHHGTGAGGQSRSKQSTLLERARDIGSRE